MRRILLLFIIPIITFVFGVGISFKPTYAACTNPTPETCGATCCATGHCAYCGCDKPLGWCDVPGSCSCPPSCSNTVTCGGLFPEWTYDSTGGYYGYGSTSIPSWTYKKAILITYVANSSCSYEWPTWSNWGGQDDIIWEGKTGFTNFDGSNAAYSSIQLTSTQHGIQWYDSLINVHGYINNRATFCGAVSLYKCFGNFSISSGTYSKSSGSSRFNSMTVTGTAVFAQTGGDLIVSTCD